MNKLTPEQLAVISSMTPAQLELLTALSKQTPSIDDKLDEFNNNTRMEEIKFDCNGSYINQLKKLGRIFRENPKIEFIAIVDTKVETNNYPYPIILPVFVRTREKFHKEINVEKCEKFIEASNASLKVNWNTKYKRESVSPIFNTKYDIETYTGSSYEYNPNRYENVKIYSLNDVNEYLRAKAVFDLMKDNS